MEQSVSKFLGFYLILVLLSCKQSPPKHTISEIKYKPSEYAAKGFFKIEDFEITSTQTFLNYSLNMIDDSTGEIILLSSKPYAPGERVKGAYVKYVNVYRDMDVSVELLVDKKSARFITRFGPMIVEGALQLYELTNW